MLTEKLVQNVFHSFSAGWWKLALPLRLRRCRRAVQRANRIQLRRNTRRVKRLNTTRNRGPLLKNGFPLFPATAAAAGACLLSLCTLYTVLFHLRQWARAVSSDCAPPPSRRTSGSIEQVFSFHFWPTAFERAEKNRRAGRSA